MNTSWTFTTTNNICIDAWQVSRWYLLHSINQRINYCYFIIDYAVACGGRFKALFLTTFLLMLLHLCSIVEGSLLHVACCARPRLTASFLHSHTAVWLGSSCVCPTASPRKVAWDLVKSKLLAGSYDSCFAHLLLRVCNVVGWFIYWLPSAQCSLTRFTAQSFLFTKLPDGFAHHILLKVLFSYLMF